MYIYIRKLFPNDANGNQISFKKDVAIHFFQATQDFMEKKQNMTIHVFHFRNERQFVDIELQPATDYRISTRLNSFLAENGDNIEVGDLLYMEKIGKSFGVQLIKEESPNYNTFAALLNTNDRHLLLCTDEEENEGEAMDDGESKHIDSKSDTNISPRQIIWYGAPGSGKSHTVNEIIDGNNSLRITFHPDTDYSSFVGAYKPTLKPVKEEYQEIQGREEEISYNFVPQIFLKAYVEAWKNYINNPQNPTPFFLVIEEINRGNCAQIFGDLFQLLDRDNEGFSSYDISTDSDIENFLKDNEKGFNGLVPKEKFTTEIKEGKKLRLPSNFFIFATMNTSDQSLFPIDSAFKRRWKWKYVPIEQPKEGLDGNPREWKISVDEHWCYWWEFLSAVNEIIEDTTHSEDKQLGYFFTKPEKGSFISAENFVSKVIFYLWNDVFKDEDNILFKYKPLKNEWGIEGLSPKRNDLYFRNFIVNSEKINEKLVHWFINNALFEQKTPMLTEDNQKPNPQGKIAFMRPFESNLGFELNPNIGVQPEKDLDVREE